MNLQEKIYWIFDCLSRRQLLNWISDATYLKLRYRAKLGIKLDLNNPKTFNEKLQWLKIHEREEGDHLLVDKYFVKSIISNRIGSEYVIPNLTEAYASPEKIDFDNLPNKFVIKCTHDSGGSYVCRDKSKIDKKELFTKIHKALKYDYYWQGRDYPYKGIERRVFVEKYMDMPGGLIDYKFYCFDGEPKFLYISQGLEDHKTARISFVDLNWNVCDFGRKDYRQFDEIPPRPSCLIEMIDIARKLSKGRKFLRVDLYEIDNHIYFSELTFFPCGGMMPFVSREDDLKVGQYLNIDE